MRTDDDSVRISKLKIKVGLAFDIRRHIQRRVRVGEPYISYGELMEEFGVDRFTLSYALGILQYLDMHVKSPLHSSLVGYKHEEDMSPGESFYLCAEELGYDTDDEPKFLAEQRHACYTHNRPKGTGLSARQEEANIWCRGCRRVVSHGETAEFGGLCVGCREAHDDVLHADAIGEHSP